MRPALPPLPAVVTVNHYHNVVPHDAAAHRVNANVNIALLWAEEVASRGFDPHGVLFECGGTTYRIGLSDKGWQTYLV